jgi:hypothetical protein
VGRSLSTVAGGSRDGEVDRVPLDRPSTGCPARFDGGPQQSIGDTATTMATCDEEARHRPNWQIVDRVENLVRFRHESCERGVSRIEVTEAFGVRRKPFSATRRTNR